MAIINDAIVVEVAADISKLRTQMDRMEKSVKGATTKSATGVKSLTKSLGGLAVAAGGLAIFGTVAKGIFNVNRETQKLMASLKTVTGSAEAATEAFAGIESFAAETPFQVEQITTAFIRMKSLGLDPSQEALRSYGNTASAMGKDLMQFVEAVADATTNEFERLKEFGIKARSEGENVSFTFQGITTTVKKSSGEINEFLMSIGENQFAGAMAEQMNTLDGIISNLQDNLASIARTIGGEGGFNSLLGQGIGFLRDWTAEIAKQPQIITDIINNLVRLVRLVGEISVAYVGARIAVSAYAASMVTATASTISLTAAVRGLLASSGIGLFALGAGLIAEFLIPWDKLMGSNDDLVTLTDNTKKYAESLEGVTAAGKDIAEGLTKFFTGMEGPEIKPRVLPIPEALEPVLADMHEVAALPLPAFLDGSKIAPAVFGIEATRIRIGKMNLDTEKIDKNIEGWLASIDAANFKEKRAEIEASADATGKMEISMSQVAASSIVMAGAFAQGKTDIEDIGKAVAKLALELGGQAIGEQVGGQPGGLIGRSIGQFIGQFFRHGGQVRQARFGMNIPSDPRGQTGVPIMAHPGETVLNRRETEFMKPLLNALQGRTSEGAVTNNFTFNTEPGGVVDESSIIDKLDKMIIGKVASARRLGVL